jgi:uncharacterized membrane protein
MANNKYDFIKELLANKNLSQEKRERILDLASKEFSIKGTLEERIRKLELMFKDRSRSDRIDNITDESNRVHVDSYLPNKGISAEEYEKIFTQKESQPAIDNEKKMTELLPKYINPSYQYRALLAYNQNPILKPTCHPMSEDNVENAIKYLSTNTYNYSAHLEIIKIEFKKLAKEQSFTTKMYSLINNYINGNGKWSNENIVASWSSNKLLFWAQENPGIAPNPDEGLAEANKNEGYQLETPFVSNLTNRSIVTFEDLTMHFKSLWHIKYGNSLKPILNKRNDDDNLADWCNVSFSNFSETLNLYTDVDKVVQAYSKLFTLIKENSDTERHSIVVSFYEEDNCKILSVHQLDTCWKKTINDTIEKPFGNSMPPIINKQINGLCNLHIRAKFENDQYAEINLWNGRKREAKKLKKFDGVQYLLIFTR